MTRREREILIASVSWTDKTLTVNEEKAFQAGARWADKTMYERIIKWLFDYCPSTAKDPELTIQNLKNAMEE